MSVQTPERRWEAQAEGIGGRQALIDVCILAIEQALSAADVEARPWRPFATEPGVREKVLWEDERSGSYAGILELEPGTRIREHFHVGLVHLLYVLAGSCELAVSLRVLGPGGYAFVPAEALHGIDRAGAEGCRMFFVQLGGIGATTRTALGADGP